MHIARDFLERVDSFADKNAFCVYHAGGSTRITFGEIARRVRGVAAALSEQVAKGERIVLWSENRPEWSIAYLSITAIGCVAVPVDSELGAGEGLNIIRSAGAAVVLGSERTLARLEAGGVSEAKTISFDSEDFRVMTEHDPAGFSVADASPDDLASIIYTSGTTGKPKGVMLTHRNFCSDAEGVKETGIITSDDNVLGILPLHHTYAFMCTFVLPFQLGATITQPASLKGPDLAHAIRDAEVTIMIGVPQLLELFYQSIKRNIDGMPFLKRLMAVTMLDMGKFFRERFDLNLGRLLFRTVHRRFGKQFRFMTSGGARLDPGIMKGLEAVGFTVLEGYGLTETSPVVTFNPPSKRKAGSAGRVLEGAEIRIEGKGDDGREGEILIRGDMVMKGYYEMPEETEKVLKEGWFSSGDLGYMDDEGYVFITGRKKEVIVLSSGKNIYPEEVEKQYLRIPLIQEIGIFEKDDALHAIIVPDFEHAKRMKIANLREALKWDIHGISIKLPSYNRIRGFALYSEPLPRTRLGKLRRFQLSGLALRAQEGKHDQGPKNAELDPDAEKVIKTIGAFLAEPSIVVLGDNLELDLGMDSLKRIELVVELEKTFEISLPETFMVDIQTVSDIVKKIDQLKKEGSPLKKEGPPRTLTDALFKEPSPEAVREIGLEGGIISNTIARVILFFVRIAARIYFRTEVKGARNIPESPFIMVANHSSYLDSFLIACSVPFSTFKRLFFQGAQEYFQGWLLRCFARLAHVIPIDPDSYMMSALSLSAHVLRNGRSLFIFPEGGRSVDGKVMPFRKGIGILSAEIGIPVVPVRLRGTFESMPRGKAVPGMRKVTIMIGAPVTIDEINELKGQEGDTYQAIADRARDRVIAL